MSFLPGVLPEPSNPLDGVTDSTEAERAAIHADHRIGSFVERAATAAVFVGDGALFHIGRPDGLTGPGDAALYADRAWPDDAVLYVVDPVTGCITGIDDTAPASEI